MMKVKTNYTGCKYIKAGKYYEAESVRGVPGVFRITDEDGDDIYCLFTGCAHIDNNNWIMEGEAA